MKNSLFYFFLLIISISSYAQDTISVQTLTFNDITNRRDIYKFPDDTTQFKKILMYYTLKCDAATTQDQYDCGEWDYLTYTTVYDNRGILDSTYNSANSFTVNGSTPDSFALSNSVLWDYFQSWQYNISHIDTMSFDTAIIGSGVDTCNIFNAENASSKFQYLYSASELIAAGLDSGDISGLRLYSLSSSGSIEKLRIKMKNVNLNSLSTDELQDSLQTVFYSNVQINQAGWIDFQFHEVFNWIDTLSVVVELSYEGQGSNPILIASQANSVNSGIFSSGINFVQSQSSGGSYVDFGNGAQQIGSSPRTYEMWGYTNAFNNGGLFQGGITGSTSMDFSLRTLSTLDKWRVQTWGSGEFDITISGSSKSWHHYAMSYDGDTLKFFYDGELVGKEEASINTDSHELWTGRWSSYYFNGKIDEFRVWNTALPDSIIRSWRNKKIDNSHPNYNNLQALYNYNDGLVSTVADESPINQVDGKLKGAAWRNIVRAENLFNGFNESQTRPNLIFEQGIYTSTIDSLAVLDSVMRNPTLVYYRNNPSLPYQITEDIENHPNLITDTAIVWDAGDYCYTYDLYSGEVIDSCLFQADSIIYKESKIWYSSLVQYEIARYITPYGKYMTLGPNGKTWIYDVTDYRHILVDSVDISAGNQQELIDLRFEFIKGEPEADVLKVSHIWHENRKSIRYKYLSDDSQLSNTSVPLVAGSNIYKVKTRLTGHGHNSNDATYPHCCEWKDNTHYLSVNGIDVADWHIFKYNDCALNPVYPQGGTWPGAREGWCPGDIVHDVEFNISSYINSDSVDIDYSITAVPADNEGMGNGNYVIAMQLIQYGNAKDEYDAELYEIMAPTDADYYARKNPMCSEPLVVIRNNGSQILSNVDIEYKVSGGPTKTFSWTGNLKFGEKDIVELPVNDESFWYGDGQNIFSARVLNPNGQQDQDTENDMISSHYNMPDVYDQLIVVWFKTNDFANSNSYTIKDINGDTIIYRYGHIADTLYKDTLHFVEGCYTLELLDKDNDGLSYWANPDQGEGYFWIRKINSVNLKVFDPDFGHSLRYSFSYGEIANVEPIDLEEEILLIYPNPSKGIYNIQVEGLYGESRLEIYNQQGSLIQNHKLMLGRGFEQKIDLSKETAGIYLLKLYNEKKVFVRKVIKH